VSVLGAATATACALVLGAAAVGHLRDPAATRRALGAHGVLPGRTTRSWLALALPVVEAGLAMGLTVALLTPAPALGRSAAVGALLLFAAFTGYLFLVLRRTAGAPPVPCGCGLGGAPLTVWSVARAGMLTALAGTTLLGGTMEGGGGLDPAAPAWAQLVVIVTAGIALALGVALLPAARAVPISLQLARGGGR
jgi:hypothetical protein